MDHGLEYTITFSVQKHMAPLVVCSGLLMVRDKLLEAPTFVRLAYCSGIWQASQQPKVVRSSYLHNGIPYTGKMASLY